MKKKIILIGSGGHAQSCLEIIYNSTTKYSVEGYLDLKRNKNFSFKYLGNLNDEKFLDIQKISKNLAICIGQIKNPKLRNNIFKKFKKLNFKFPIIKSKNSIISKETSIGDGTMIFNNVLINRDAKIGENSILNNCCLIEHGVNIGSNCHISTGAIINGESSIGNNCFIGSGAILHQSVSIGNNCIISAGQIVRKNVKSNTVIK